MADICPTVLAASTDEYSDQIKRVSFAPRVQLDFMDGIFAPTTSIDLKDAWWPDAIKADLHLMYKTPGNYLETILEQKPNLVIIHAEADVDHVKFAEELHAGGIKTGLCVLPQTAIADVADILKSFDHLLIFGGNLGHFGGQADLSQLNKIKDAKAINPSIEIGWDGGANDQNARQMVNLGVDVINVGGFIQKAENPEEAYQKLVAITV